MASTILQHTSRQVVERLREKMLKEPWLPSRANCVAARSVGATRTSTGSSAALASVALDFCTRCASDHKQGCERGYFLNEAASRCKKGIQGYNATKLRVYQGCSTSHYGLLLGTPLAKAKNLLPGGEDTIRLLAARVKVTHQDALPWTYRVGGRFRGPLNKSDPTKEAGNGAFPRNRDMIKHPNSSIQGTPELVISLMQCVFERKYELPTSDFCCVMVHREANAEVKMLEMRRTVGAVEEEAPSFVEEEHTPLCLFTEWAALDLFPPTLENEWEQREDGCGFNLGEGEETTEEEIEAYLREDEKEYCDTRERTGDPKTDTKGYSLICDKSNE